MAYDDGYRNQYGFGRHQSDGSGVWWVFGPDKQDSNGSHAIACQFITTIGALPCSCDATRARFTEWWTRWLYWSMRHHTAHSNTAFPIPWPVVGADGSPWIRGIDFD